MKDWKKIPDQMGCKAYFKNLLDGSELFVLVGKEPKNNGPDVFHMSISCRSFISNKYGTPIQKRIPTFEEIKEARYRFIPNDVNMAMLFPPVEHWISLPNSCVIHLWEVPLECAEISK